MNVVENPLELIRSQGRARIVFLGPQWGAIMVDVEGGRPVSLQSSWGDTLETGLRRLAGWRRVRYILKEPQVGAETRAEAPKPLYRGSLEGVANPRDLPRGYMELVRDSFAVIEKRYGSEAWMNAIALSGEMGGLGLMVLRGEGWGWMMVRSGKIVAAIWKGNETLYNLDAVREIAELNQYVPMEIEIRRSRCPGALALALPLLVSPTLRGRGEAVARALSGAEAYALLWAGKRAAAKAEGELWSLPECQKISMKELAGLLGPEEAVLYENVNYRTP